MTSFAVIEQPIRPKPEDLIIGIGSNWVGSKRSIGLKQSAVIKYIVPTCTTNPTYPNLLSISIGT